MRACVLKKIKQLVMADYEAPECGPGEVLVRLRSIGLCGSDVHYWKHGRIGPSQVVTAPLILGHEPAGEIVATGPGVTTVRVDDRVAVEPAITCGRCPRCLEGRPNLCYNVVFLGTPPIDGAFREFLLMPEHNVVKIPDGMSFDAAALLEPLGIGLHTVNLAGIEPGDAVGIFGSGPIGLSCLLGALARGASRVVVTDRIDARLSLARKLGATHTVNIDQQPASEVVGELTGGYGLDRTIEAAGDPGATADAFACVRRGGSATLVGIPVEDVVSMPIHEVRRKELTIQNVRRSNRMLERAVDLVASGRIDPTPMATHHFGLDEIEQAMLLVDGYRDGVVKAMIHP